MYQKMISYIYEYRNGERGKNIGFAKMALQNQNYKIKIQLRLLQGGKSELAVYGFIRGDGIIHTAYFGSVKVENGLGDVMFSGNGAKVWKEKNFMKMSGFLFLPKEQLVYGTISHFCATQWDDAPIVMDTLDMLQNRKEKQDEAWGEEQEMVKHQECILHAAELVDELECEGKESIFQKQLENMDMLEQIPKTAKADTEKISTESVQMETMDTEKPLEESEEEPDIEEIKASHSEEREDSWQLFEQRRKSMRKKWETIKQECTSEKGEWKQGEEILKKFPVMNPFFDKEVAASVRIEPKDLGNLPMEHWYLANNSFLLHGYYYYRHLLFLKICNQQEYMYAIAVPGNNDYRENFMANMFGFEQFKVVQNRNNAGFGYWWRQIV